MDPSNRNPVAPEPTLCELAMSVSTNSQRVAANVLQNAAQSKAFSSSQVDHEKDMMSSNSATSFNSQDDLGPSLLQDIRCLAFSNKPKLVAAQLHTQSTCEPPALAYDSNSSEQLTSNSGNSEPSNVCSIFKLFKRDGILGEGTYGTVYRAVNRSTGETVALKKLHWNSPMEGIPATSIREVVVLKGLSHPNIVKLKGIHYESKVSSKNSMKIFLEFEYLELDLRKYMKTFPQRQIPLSSIKSIMYQLFQGLAYCHSRRIIHRDIKPNNILILFRPHTYSKALLKRENSDCIHNKLSHGLSSSDLFKASNSSKIDGMMLSEKNLTATNSCQDSNSAYQTHFKQDVKKKIRKSSLYKKSSKKKKKNLVHDEIIIKIADFGLARILPFPLRPLTREVVTLWYRAPEILLGALNYTPAIDIWAAGCLFAELLYGRAVFPGDVEIDTLFKVFQLLGTPDESTWKGVSKLPYYKAEWPKWQKRPDRFDYFRENLEDSGKDLLSKLLNCNPFCRISATEALKHEWFNSVRYHKGFEYTEVYD